jgi:hypothetical protein
MRPHVSIGQLLALMIPIAVGLCAVTNPSAFWEGTVFVVTLILLFTAIVGAIYRKSGARAFWLGFSLFGWGFLLVCSEISFEFRAGNQRGTSYPMYYWGNADEEDHPVRGLTKSLVDVLQLDQRVRPKSVGEKIKVQWGSALTYYPSSVLEIKEDQYKIRYDSDPAGSYDEWVGINRIKLLDLDRIYRIGESLAALSFAHAGAVIARYFHATRKANDADRQPLRRTASRNAVPATPAPYEPDAPARDRPKIGD